MQSTDTSKERWLQATRRAETNDAHHFLIDNSILMSEVHGLAFRGTKNLEGKLRGPARSRSPHNVGRGSQPIDAAPWHRRAAPHPMAPGIRTAATSAVPPAASPRALKGLVEWMRSKDSSHCVCVCRYRHEYDAVFSQIKQNGRRGLGVRGQDRSPLPPRRPWRLCAVARRALARSPKRSRVVEGDDDDD